MLAGVIGATLVPNVLRWHWWRFNGWGYAAGIFAGLGTAMIFGTGQNLGWFGARNVPEYVYAPFIWAASIVGCLAGSLMTPATSNETLRTFYERVRPFGWWKPVRLLSKDMPRITSLRFVLPNVLLGLIGLVASFLSVFFLIGHYFEHLVGAAATVLVCAALLYFTWYRRLRIECAD
jgi:hypothetical protein